MNEEHLIEVFNEGFENFKNFKWDDEKLILKRAPAKHDVYVAFMKHFYTIYTNEIIFDFESLVIQTQNDIDKELSFYSERKKIEEIINLKIEGIAKNYLNNPYNFYANTSNIMHAFFEPENYKQLSFNLFSKYQEKFVKWFDSNGSITEIEEILDDDIATLNQLFAVLIENNLLNDRLQKLKSYYLPESISEKRLSINQTVLLLDKLKFIQKIEHNTLTIQARLISKICGYHEKNIKNSLERLGAKQSVWSNQYKKDVKIVNNTISELELILDKENGTN